MGLMDKVRAQATQLAQKTQEAAQEGKARYDQAQANRRGDMLLRQLGAQVYADRTGRGESDSQSKIDQLINDLSAHERTNGLNLSQSPVPQQGAGTTTEATPEGQGTSYASTSGNPGAAPQYGDPQYGDPGTTQYTDAPYSDTPPEPGQSQTYFAPPADDGQPGWDRPGQYPGS